MLLREQALDPTLGVGHKLDAEETAHLIALAKECEAAATELLSGPIEERADAGIAYKTLSGIAAAGVRRGSPEVVEAAVGSLFGIYRLGDYAVGNHLETPPFEASLWESIWIEIAALGGLIVRRQAWSYLKTVALRDPNPEKPHYVTWYRHGQVHSARSSTDPNESVLRVAANRLSELEPEDGANYLKEICQFDLLAALLIAEVDADRKFYPNAAAFSERNVEPMVVDHLRSKASPLRSVIFPDSDDALQAQLREYNELALAQASLYRYSNNQDWAWRGFQDGRTWAFIRSGQLLEDWQSLPI